MTPEPLTPESPMTPRMLRLTRVAHELEDAVTLHLDATPLSSAAFAPGQFNLVYLFGVGEAALPISGDPARPRRLEHTVRGRDAVTRALCAAPRGSLLGVRGPFGTGWPLAELEGREVLLIAGGMGLAALRSAVLALLASRPSLARLTLLYGARSPAELLYRRELEAWRAQGDVRVEVFVDNAGPGWAGQVGVVASALPTSVGDPARTSVLLAGPEVLERFVVRELRRLGVRDEHVHVALERSLRCGVGLCGHCHYGPHVVCREGPVLRLDRIAPHLYVREL